MLRLTIKNYLSHFPYSVFLILQMVMILFIVNNTLIEVVYENKVLENVTFEKNLYFVEKNEKSEKKFIEEVTQIVGKNCVGYMYSSNVIRIDEMNEIETPPLKYLNTTMEKIHYALKEGNGFSQKEKEIILGGKIAQKYHVGDEIILKKENTKKKVRVVGILKEPGKIIHLTGSSGENLFSSMNQGKSVMLTNSKELYDWMGDERRIEANKVMIDAINQESCIQTLKEKYEVISLEKAKNNGKKEIIKNTVGNLLYMCILVGAAFTSVGMQIYIFMKKNKEEYQIYRLLGLGTVGIFRIWCTEHIVNLGIVTIILYILFHLTGTMEEINNASNIFSINGIFHIVYCCFYIAVTIFVYNIARKSLEILDR